jgi:uncharacterized protein DUF6916
MDTRDLVLGDFSPSLGEAFELDLGGGTLSLTLEQTEELPQMVRAGGSFRLLFRGPRQPLLPQAIYSFARGDETYSIFIVPIAQDGESTTYEAVFH